MHATADARGAAHRFSCMSCQSDRSAEDVVGCVPWQAYAKGAVQAGARILEDCAVTGVLTAGEGGYRYRLPAGPCCLPIEAPIHVV